MGRSKKQDTKLSKESNEVSIIELATTYEENQIGSFPLFDELYFEFWKR